MKRICQKELARKLGVSQAAVSGVLNGNPAARIGEKTRNRILEALKEANYQPNRLANALFGRETKTVGVIYQGGYVQLGVRKLSAIVKSLTERGFLPLIYDLMLDVKGDEQCQLLCDLNVRGTILINVTEGFISKIYPKYLQGKMNVAAIDCPPREGLYQLYSDRIQGFRLLTEHLLERGYRKIALLVSQPPRKTSASSLHGSERALRGVTEALGKAGLKPEGIEYYNAKENLSPYPADPYWAGMLGLRSLLDKGCRPDAVICSSDAWAIGALHECARRGIDVPGEIAIAGFNDDVQSQYTSVPLTTIAPPVDALADLAVRHIVETTPEDISNPVLLPCDLVLRASTGVPSKPFID